MRITQGTFSFLPDFTAEEIRKEVEYILRQGWACSIEYTDDPHPRNTYWEMWGLPLFDLTDSDGVMRELEACREANPRQYIKLNAFDATHGVESTRLSFIVQRPPEEHGFDLRRSEAAGRRQAYALVGYATKRPQGQRY